MVVLKFFRRPAQSSGAHEVSLGKISIVVGKNRIKYLDTEICFYVLVECEEISAADEEKFLWVFMTPFQAASIKRHSFFQEEPQQGSHLLEIGPRLNFSTPFSTNAVSICHSIGLKYVSRIEYSLRYLLKSCGNGLEFSTDEINKIASLLHDRMTQCIYAKPIDNFDPNVTTDPVFEVDVQGEGRLAMERINKKLGLAFDDWDLEYYCKLFKEKIGRNPTSIECFDLAQSNSEHSRHWFFKGRLVVDGEEHKQSLFEMVMDTHRFSNGNNVIKFSDNSSGIEGFAVKVLVPSSHAAPSPLVIKDSCQRHIIFTAETHNFPTGVAPFPGATTGTGGRIRDIHCTGKGAHVVAGTAGYSFGNLNIPGYHLPWEDDQFQYPNNFAQPVEVAVEASNGASDYGNKFGEPVLAGFARSFGLQLPTGERREFVKPIMFSGGVGMLEGSHVRKAKAEKGMKVVKVGGPAYRIGVGGGAASSVEVQGNNRSELDFRAVQRGDAEMEQKLNRVIRACVELFDRNPICSIHDQGSGGNGNVLKEIVEPAGAIIHAKNFQLADPTLSILELWGAEYQESNALLTHPENEKLLSEIGQRERCPVCFVGSVTGDAKIRLEDFAETNSAECGSGRLYPVDLELEHVLGSMPRKVFKLDRVKVELPQLKLPDALTVRAALDRVLRLPSVASKRYLTNKVDRSVTGLVAQQQCVGPLHTPLADVAVTALTYFDTVGSATAIGEQPVKGLVDPCCGARMSVGEALTNLVFARITALEDVKCSGNWMWPAKLPGEGVGLFDACKAMCSVMETLGIAVDGGKDSLSMAARVGSETVKAPVDNLKVADTHDRLSDGTLPQKGTLVVSVYAPCPDITATVTPDLKCLNGKGILIYVDASKGKRRTGGTALAQCYGQIGNESPDMDNPDTVKNMFVVTQKLIIERKILAGHDVSDGGIITCLLEMAFAGNCGISVDLPGVKNVSAVENLFSEELGLMLEVNNTDVAAVLKVYRDAGLVCHEIGQSCITGPDAEVNVRVDGQLVLNDAMVALRDAWEETSFRLEQQQTNHHCVDQEESGLKWRKEPPYHLSFDPNKAYCLHTIVSEQRGPDVAILREEGSNGDREMAAAFHAVGFQTWDVNMEDLCSGKITLDRFRGVAFVGGFSYADVCGSGKGWAATALFNSSVKKQFANFYQRNDTFSLGVCNGCQLMALLGWVVPDDAGSGEGSFVQGLFLDHNLSEKFESRFVTVKISKSPALMFSGMEGTVFGITLAHGEGRMVFKNQYLHEIITKNNLVPMHYVDDNGKPTCQYPFNPNGSPDGIAAVCSHNGRHLAIMPHPERCFLPWQCPWMPYAMQQKLTASPWLQMFKNAHEWCT